MTTRRMAAVAISASLVVAWGATQSGSASAAPDRFYTYSGHAALTSYVPGSVLKTRTMRYHVAGIATPLLATQILFRSTGATGAATANVTSVISPPGTKRSKGVVSYQSAYDSLNPEDGPSRAVAGDVDLGPLTPVGRNVHIGSIAANAENGILTTVLALGYSVNIPDTEGQDADFAAGPEYGMNTLDSLRAIAEVPSTGTDRTSRIGLIGYSGGAIASNWAAILAPGYAPDVNARLIGVAQGGLLVNPSRNLRYVSGSYGWAGVTGMAIKGVSRAYGFDLDKYLSNYGRQTLRQLSDASILNFWYPGLTWRKLMKPQFADPRTVPEFVDAVNELNMGTAAIPTVPMFIAQAANGIIELTPPGSRDIGPGDGVMITGDVRALAKRYCDNGLAVAYHQYDVLSHTTGAVVWLAESVPWLLDRFAGRPAPDTCGQIAPGNKDAFAQERHMPSHTSGG
ncbi:lipase family protein [Williamsia herbipolensis]|uniref:Lipase family protein n=1 Tax=Williamsia herbipolensis TaxID=1603258 RepID=A0AAU4JZF1_9NOCA|nr:lipase family protein [Williamsia herbipolensis]